MLIKNILFTIFVIEVACNFTYGADGDPDIDAIEAEFSKKKEEPKASIINDSKESTLTTELGAAKEIEEAPAEVPIQFRDLSKLVPFSEVSVIQKKFLPKKNRLQLHLGLNHLSNNPFYDTVGLTGRLAFFFSESIGLEASGMALYRSPKYVTIDLKENHGVLTSSIVSANSYYGLDLVLIPFYGKITWLDEKIIPYDFYLSIGGGLTGLSDVKDQASTVHIGVGQIYAITKNFVLRWDLSGNNYQAEIPELTKSDSVVSKKRFQSFNDVFLGGGISILFPGASYR